MNNFKGDFQILSYYNKLYINGKLIYSAFRLCINLNFEKLTLKTGFVVHGHICLKITSNRSTEDGRD